ncbi:peptidoglycan-binding domain-containing protein [Streptomyces sp. NPDC094032]|uniref:peptidoglycan-binding domain-containing protein n=1 Tax=Streptomyces sp. NPDC094032 TaxID=3155308 RepID=UPI00331A58E3
MEVAAAEDFDPLRIRPYVTLSSTEDATAMLPGVPGAGAGAPPGPLPGPLPAEVPAPRSAGDPSQTMPLFLPGVAERASAYGEGHAPAHSPAPGYAPDATATPGYEPSPDPYESAHTLAYAPEGRGRSGRGRTLVVAGVVAAAVVGTAVMAAAMIGGDGTDDRAAVPEVTTSASENIAVSEEPSTAPTPTETASPSARTASAAPTASASPKTVRTSAAATTAAPATAPPKTAPSSAPEAVPSATEDQGGPTLSLGSTGDEVAELQRRLKELWLYNGPEDGTFSKKVERAVKVYQSYKYVGGDPEGVYGPSTRRALEADTTG